MAQNFVVDQCPARPQAAVPEILKPNDDGEKPIAITITDQEIGRLFHDRTSPDRYRQYLLEKFQDAGAPIGGVLNKHLLHGKLARVKPDINHPGVFHYLWLPESHVAGLIEAQKQMACH